MLLAYDPVATPDLQTYVAFAQTEPGRDLNLALMSVFDEMFSEVSDWAWDGRAPGAGADRSRISESATIA